VLAQTAAAAFLAEGNLFVVFAHCSSAAVGARRLVPSVLTLWFAVYWFGRPDETAKITMALAISNLSALPDTT
jgi:hypothetical protein